MSRRRMPLAPLHQHRRSLELDSLVDTLCADSDWLIIQDLDGVCMGLVRDPRRRRMDPDYLRAAARLAGRFYVLTNGEHVGPCGVNGLVEEALADSSPAQIAEQALYLPGLAAGGVQLQDARGELSHPGVSERELSFLAEIPSRLRASLGARLAASPFDLPAPQVEDILRVVVLDNRVSPTINIGSLYDQLGADRARYLELQRVAHDLLEELLQDAAARGLRESFFAHLAPNLGTVDGVEQPRPATATDMGTTDFQFMLRGAIKDVGVVVLLNHHYHEKTGHYPLGPDFNARNAPHELEALLSLAEGAFDPALMPRIVAVGDTVTSAPAPSTLEGVTPPNVAEMRRGGSDRGFLRLVQELGRRFQRDNAVVFVDSSGGELERPGVDPSPDAQATEVPVEALRGITDPADPLRLNFIVPGGHRQYVELFGRLAPAPG